MFKATTGRRAFAASLPADLKSGTNWMRAPLDASSRNAKKTALEAYSSQLATTPNYLRSFLRRNELFGVVTAPKTKRVGGD